MKRVHLVKISQQDDCKIDVCSVSASPEKRNLFALTKGYSCRQELLASISLH